MKRGQLYVVQCHTPVNGNKVGLGLCDSQYLKGDYVTCEGEPTQKLSKAHVYKWGDEDNSLDFEDIEWDWGTLDMYFQYVPVELKIIKKKV